MNDIRAHKDRILAIIETAVVIELVGVDHAEGTLAGAPAENARTARIATARLADMRMTLGAEAYSDAQNPLIASTDGTEYSGAVFCFANQVPTLLDEELALLRGRTKNVAPAMNEFPFYNRLMWNFTKGVTQGEVAYANNYNILGSSVAAIENALNGVDAGLNPLGLSDDAIPFDISPGEYEGSATRQEAKCHYEQIRDRVGTSLANAKKVLDYANVYGSRLREIENEQLDTEAEAAEMEQSYETQLVEIYGRPYTDDIGPGKTYEQGYTGPDLYHYMYAELDDYGLESVNSYTNNLKIEVVSGDAWTTDWYKNVDLSGGSVTNGMTLVMRIDSTISYTVSADGFIAKPKDFVGMRASEGLLQKSYRDFLSAYVSAKSANDTYLTTLQTYETELASVQLKLVENDGYYTGLADNNSKQRAYNYTLLGLDLTKTALGVVIKLLDKSAKEAMKAVAMEDIMEHGFNTVCFVYDDGEEGSKFGNEDTAKGNAITAIGNWAKAYAIRKELTKILNDREEYYQYQKGLSGSQNYQFGKGDRSKVEDVLKTAKLTSEKGVKDVIAAIDEQFKVFDSAIGGNENKVFSDDLDAITKAGEDASNKAKAKTQDGKTNFIGVKVSRTGKVTYTTNNDKAEYAVYSSLNGNLTEIDRIAAEKLDQKADERDAQQGNENSADVVAVENVDVPAVVGKLNKGAFKKMLIAINEKIVKVIYNGAWLAKTGFDATATILDSVLQDTNIQLQERQNDYQWYADSKKLYESLVSTGEDLVKAGQDVIAAHAALLEAAQTYLAVVDEGEALQEMREKERARLAATSTAARYRDMYARTARNAALSKYRTAFDAAQRQVFQLAKAYDYETGMGSTGTSAGKGTFADAAIATRALGTESVVGDGSSVTDPGLWDVVNRMDANFAQLKTQLGINNPDESEKWFSLRTGLLNLSSGSEGDESWRAQLAAWWREDVFADSDVARLCQKPAGSSAAEPGFVIPFESAIYADRNFFNQIQGRNNAGSVYSSSDCSVKIYSVGVDFVNYDNLVAANALVAEPNVYLVPAGTDYLRAPSNNVRVVRSFNIVDQVLPIPYAVSEDEVKAAAWSVSSGLGSQFSTYGTRRFSTMRACAGLSSTRLVGRSVWNDRWVLVIPARYLHSNTETARRNFLYDAKGLGGVKDIKIGIKAYSRSGN